MAVPGWPLPTFSTASAARTRMVSTARWSKLVHDSSCSSKCGTKTGPLSVLAFGGTPDPVKGALLGARCGVYQPFTIETLILAFSHGQQRECVFHRFLAAC